MTSGSSSRFRPPDRALAAKLIRDALREDRADRDLTSRAVISAGLRAEGALVARAPGTVAGLPVALAVFRAVSAAVRVSPAVRDGTAVRRGRRLARCTGPLRALLAAERVALNLLGRLSGIATLTRRYVRAVRPFPVAILDTRKTTPLLRDLEKYAVRCGGGRNHRRSLADGVLIKDNHLAAAGSAGLAVRLARRTGARLVEVEADALPQVREALDAGADIILLDNMRVPAAGRALALIRRRPGVRAEISGGVTLANVRRYARLKPDAISIGALTHSAPALDVSLDITRLGR